MSDQFETSSQPEERPAVPNPLPNLEDETDEILAKAKREVNVAELFGAPRSTGEGDGEGEEEEDAGLLPKRARARAKKSVDTSSEMPDAVDHQWYVVHAQSGHENRVHQNIVQRVKQAEVEHLVPEVLVPSEEVAEVKAGKKHISRRKSYPGYVFVKMQLTNDVWQLIKTTPGVTGFLGTKKAPTPLQSSEMEQIFEEIRGEADKPKPKVMFEINEQVKIIEGPFQNFTGYVDDVNVERGRLKVLVEVFERRTPVECEFWQVEKI